MPFTMNPIIFHIVMRPKLTVSSFLMPAELGYARDLLTTVF